MEENKTLVHLENVVLYQGITMILNNIDIDIDKGEFAYLIGKTGSGKSTLLKAIYGDLEIKSGKGDVLGFDLSKMSWRKVPYLRRKLGIVFQDFQLLTDRSINENLDFVLKATGWTDKKKMDYRMDDVLSKVGLKTKGFKMPHELSGGEQQRVVIARALLNEPELILADEPTGNLDPDTSDDIMNLLMDINKNSNTAILMATHNYNILEKFPGRIIRCANGLVIDEENIIVR